MNTELILNIVMTGVQLITVLTYSIMFLRINKKEGKSAVEKIYSLIPNYITIAKATLPNCNTNKIINYVLAMMKSEFEEASIKYKEKELKEKITNNLNKEEEEV